MFRAFAFKFLAFSIPLLCIGVGAPAFGEPRAVSSAVPAYLGTWRISASRRAPWAAAGAPGEAAEVRRLTGARIQFTKAGILGPAPLNCRGATYSVRQYGLDMLFQGTLPDPARNAAALGFEGTAVTTLETGCGGPIDFHFTGARTAMFGLNNVIYTLVKMR